MGWGLGAGDEVGVAAYWRGQWPGEEKNFFMIEEVLRLVLGIRFQGL